MADENLTNQDGEQTGKNNETPKEDPKGPKIPDTSHIDKEIESKAKHLDNINKAIAEANETLQTKRLAVKQPQSEEEKDEESDEVPQIDLEDPSSKAWDRHIKNQVNPMQQELEKEKQDVRTLALRDFLADKPALASDSSKLKEVIEVYDRLKTGSERVKESVISDLTKAFAAVFHDKLIDAARTARVQDAKQQQLFVSPAVDSGATGYTEERDRTPAMTESDRQILAKWGLTPQQWFDMKKSQDSKK